MYKKDVICMKEFIPTKVLCNKEASRKYDLKSLEFDSYLALGYFVPCTNTYGSVGKRFFSTFIPKHISRNIETFEVLGLLQGEMGKQLDGKVNFCNHEFKLVNKVIRWFEKELNFPRNQWKWYIKVNINEPLDQKYKQKVEDKAIQHWTSKTGLSLSQAYPKRVSYVKNVSHKKLKFYDYGSLIIERKRNLFSQVIKKLTHDVFNNILHYNINEIRAFMRGIIAGESNVEVNKLSGHYRVFITAVQFKERQLFHYCLNKLGIDSTLYPNFTAVIISKKHNNLELLKQQLMTLSPEKYNKFLSMMNLYDNFEGLIGWRNNLQRPHNKIPDWVINEIIELHFEDPSAPAWKIAQELQRLVSEIKVQRVRKEFGLTKALNTM